VIFAVVIDGRHGEPRVRSELDGDLGEAGANPADQTLEDGEGSLAGMGRPRTEHRGDQVAGVPIEDQQGMEHVLLAVPMVGDALLVASAGRASLGDPLRCRVIGAVEVEDDALGDPIASSFLQMELHERHGEVVAGFVAHGILQPGEGRLAGQIRLVGQPATDQLEERITAQGIGIVLVFIATGNLKDPLTDEGLQ
jgi:hypothetical protein